MQQQLFPEIKTISDVLPHISGRDEFSITEKNGYKVICYNVETDGTFDDAFRRECRGIIFNDAGEIISRPFHKFFNVGQKAETQPNLIDVSKPHHLLTKADGSLIQVFQKEKGGELIFGTKRGETDIAASAANHAFNVMGREFLEWVRTIVESGFTPLFEWVSPNPETKIVLNYEHDDLILIAARDRITGEYIWDLGELNCPSTVIKHNENAFDDVATLIVHSRRLEGEEGYVLVFEDGQRIKFKSDWYLQIHKAKELVQQERHIVLGSINNTLDDVIGVLPMSEHERVERVVGEFWKAFDEKKAQLNALLDECNKAHGSDFKGIALEFMPKVEKESQGILWQNIRGGKYIHDALLELVKKKAERSMKEFNWFQKSFLNNK